MLYFLSAMLYNADNFIYQLGVRFLKKALYWILIAVFSVVFIVSAVIVGKYMIASHQYKQEMSDIQQLHSVPVTRPAPSLRLPTIDVVNPTLTPNPTGPDGTEPPFRPTQPDGTTASGMLPEMEELYALNNDVVGYIYVPGTNINYPVLQRTTEKDYYLYRDIYCKRKDHGSIYVREACDVFDPSDNVTIYGHNMADGSMFAGVLKFKNRTFFKEHQLIYFDTLYERHIYQIVCIFRTSGDYGVGFPYHLYDNFKDEAEFKEFIKGIRALAIRDSGISVKYGDKFICLSTCEERPIKNGRLVLLAVRIS